MTVTDHDLGPGPDPGLVAALPTGTVELGVALRRRGLCRLRALGDDVDVDVDVDEVIASLVLPRLVSPAWPGPSAPIAVGDGAVHADIADDDAEVFGQLMAAMAEVDADAEEVALTAQEWRLPVTPYRPPAPVPEAGEPRERHDTHRPGRSRQRRRGLAGVRVLDLSALWAGPLCTALLARHGAQVVKVDPSCRPDGFGATPALYDALNGAKEVVDLDLRRAADRDRFDRLIRRSDVLVTSFSRRVLPNLGYDRTRLRRLNPELHTLAITAFGGHRAERDWLAYGGGVHAASGLGLLDGRPRPAPVSYPDPLAGLAAFARVLDLLAQDHAGDAEVALADVVAPLVRRAGARR